MTKKILLLSILFTLSFFWLTHKNKRAPSSYKEAQATFTVSGVVPVILKVNVIKQTETSYIINEISNNPEGYILSLQTDVNEVYFDKQKLTAKNGIIVLNTVGTQTESINSFKILNFSKQPSILQVSIISP